MLDGEQHRVREFFGAVAGFFVEVGANDPHSSSQTWHLEQLGWDGVLVEPHPQLAAALRRERKAAVYEVACSSPANRGARMPLHLAGAMSSLSRDQVAPGARPLSAVDVTVMTLDDVLIHAKAPTPIDLVSVDVEGHEVEVLRGFDLARWQPRLVLLEDHVGDLTRHRFMQAQGYRLARRTGFNGWYVPPDCPARFDLGDRLELLRKYYLALPIRVARNAWRRVRQPFKEPRSARG